MNSVPTVREPFLVGIFVVTSDTVPEKAHSPYTLEMSGWLSESMPASLLAYKDCYLGW